MKAIKLLGRICFLPLIGIGLVASSFGRDEIGSGVVEEPYIDGLYNSDFENLPQGALNKTTPETYEKLFSSEEPEFILLLKSDEELFSRVPPRGEERALWLESLSQYYEQIKGEFLNRFSSSEIEVLHRYSHLPMLHLKVSGREILLEVLSLREALHIYEIEYLKPNLAESLPLINQPASVTGGHIGAGTTVAVIDTGVDFTHGDFGTCTDVGVPAGCRVIHAQDFAPDDGERDDNGHGTNVGGIVAGTAPGTRIAALDVFGAGVRAANADITGAINWVIANHNAHNIVAMNLSLGDGTNNAAVCAASWATAPFANARNVDVLPVVAAGNAGFINGVEDPACTAGAVRVGAVYDGNVGTQTTTCTDATTAADQVTCFSNSGDLLTLWAPGSLIAAGGRTMRGTSQAAPHVAGAIAILRAADVAPAVAIDETVNQLTLTGTNIADPRNAIVRPRINVGAAVIFALNDLDGDGVPDPTDNCPTVSNSAQTDTDSDGQGDACDTDDDNDGLTDVEETKLGSNPLLQDTDKDGLNDGDEVNKYKTDPLKADSDGDGISDGEEVKMGLDPIKMDNPAIPIIISLLLDEEDIDGDGIADDIDNCPSVSNTDQKDTDGDKKGDVCDDDDDNDGIPDTKDNCPLAANASQTDTDGDKSGDACDTDDDNDGVLDVADNCPLISNKAQTDTDGDKNGDDCDDDDDNDSVLDATDNCPKNHNPGQEDLDGDGIGDACELIQLLLHSCYERWWCGPMIDPWVIKNLKKK